MSSSLKIVLIIIALGAVGGFYKLKKNEAQFNAELSPHQDLTTVLKTDGVELKTFESWCAEQGHVAQALESCILNRKARAKKLLMLEQEANKKSTVIEAQEGGNDTQEKGNKPIKGKEESR